jgi:hypothetical protein
MFLNAPIFCQFSCNFFGGSLCDAAQEVEGAGPALIGNCRRPDQVSTVKKHVSFIVTDRCTVINRAEHR